MHGKEGSSYTIPSSVTTIAENAFLGADLSSINIPSSVTTIKPYAFNSAFDRWFYVI